MQTKCASDCSTFIQKANFQAYTPNMPETSLAYIVAFTKKCMCFFLLFMNKVFADCKLLM